MTSTEQYTATAQQFKGAAEQAAQFWKQGAQALTDQAEMLSRFPKIDPTAGVQRYFDLLQKSVDMNRDLATSWADALNAMTGSLGSQFTAVAGVARRQLDTAADVVTSHAEVIEEVAVQQAEVAEAEAKAEARRVRAAERAAEKEAQEKAREPYQGLTKAELSEKLAERDLPKTGNLDELVDRLVESDVKQAPYRGLTKAELSDQLAERDLPKTGVVEELISRLVEADEAAAHDDK